MQKQYSIIVNAPIETVFAILSEKQHLDKHYEGKSEIKITTANDFSDPVGTKFHQKIAGLLELDGEIIAYTYPLELGIGIEVNGLKGTIFYNLKNVAPDQTNLMFNLEFFDGTKAKKILLSTLQPLYNKIIGDYLASIKKLAEQETVASA